MIVLLLWWQIDRIGQIIFVPGPDKCPVPALPWYEDVLMMVGAGALTAFVVFLGYFVFLFFSDD